MVVLSDPRPSTHFNIPDDCTGCKSDDIVDDLTMDASHPRSWRTDLISSGVSGGPSFVVGLQIIIRKEEVIVVMYQVCCLQLLYSP